MEKEREVLVAGSGGGAGLKSKWLGYVGFYIVIGLEVDIPYK